MNDRKERAMELQKRRAAIFAQMQADKEVEYRKIKLAEAEYEAGNKVNEEFLRKIDSELDGIWYEEEVIRRAKNAAGDEQ